MSKSQPIKPPDALTLTERLVEADILSRNGKNSFEEFIADENRNVLFLYQGNSQKIAGDEQLSRYVLLGLLSSAFVIDHEFRSGHTAARKHLKALETKYG